MPTSRPPLFQGMRSLIAMVYPPRFKRLPPRKSRRGSRFADVSVASRSGRLAVDLPDVGSGRACDRDTTRLHGLREFAHQFDLQQAVVERGSPDLDIVREIELPLEGPRRNSLVEEFALLFFRLPAFHGQHALFRGDCDFIGRETGDRQRDLVAVFAQALDVARW